GPTRGWRGRPFDASGLVLSADHAADGRAGLDVGGYRARQPTAHWRGGVVATGDARRCGDCGHPRDHAHSLCLLPLRRAYHRAAWQERYQRGGAALGLHPAVHRHSDLVDRLQHAHGRAAVTRCYSFIASSRVLRTSGTAIEASNTSDATRNAALIGLV